MKSFVTLLAIVVLLVSARCDACPDIAKGNLLKYEDTLKCLSSLPLPASVKADSIDSISKMLDLYVFTPMLKYPPADYADSQVDLVAGLKEVERRQHNSDYELQMDLRQLMSSARDLHSQWHPSTYTMVFLRALPFILVPRTNPMAKHGFDFVLINFPSVDLEEYRQTTGIELDRSLEGQAVATINGQDPIEFVSEWADKHIGARTKRQRLLMAVYGGFSIGLMGSDFTEEKLVLSIETENGDRFKMEPVGVAETDIHGTETLEQISPLQSFMGQEPHPMESVRRSEHGTSDDGYLRFVQETFGRANRFALEHEASEVIARSFAAYKGDSDLVLEHKGTDMTLFRHTATNTCIWKLDTFAPQEITPWIEDMLTIADIIADRECDTNGHVILDERENGGGMVTLSLALWTVLVGSESLWPAAQSRIKYRYDNTELRLHRDIRWNSDTTTEYEMKPYDTYAARPEYSSKTRTQMTPVSWLRDQILQPYNKEEIRRELESDRSLPADYREGFLLLLDKIVDRPIRMKLNNMNFAVLVGSMSASCSAFTATRIYDSNIGKVVDIGVHDSYIPYSNQLALVPGSDTVGIDQVIDGSYLKPFARGASASFGNMGAVPALLDMGRKVHNTDSDDYTYAFSVRRAHETLDIMNSALPIDGAYSGTRRDLLNVVTQFEEKNIWNKCFENQFADEREDEATHAVVGRPCNARSGRFQKNEQFIRCAYSTKPTGKLQNGIPVCKPVKIFYIEQLTSDRCEAPSTGSKFGLVHYVAGGAAITFLAAVAIVVAMKARKQVTCYTAI